MTTRWGILATGRIARKFADAVVVSHTGQLAAVGSRTQEHADRFASHYGQITAYGSYQSLIDDLDIDAIYVATPHPQHAEWTIKAVESGKAVLCEKPMGLNHAQVMAMVEAASGAGVFLMEAFMYRTHPQTDRLLELVRDGAIGEIRHIHASFGFHVPFSAEHRLFANHLAGGGIMDVGCYPVSFARLIAGSEPDRVTAHGRLGPTGTDSFAAALLHFADGIAAQIATGVELNLQNTVELFGSSGRIQIPAPWICPADWSFQLVRGSRRETIRGSASPAYVHEVDEVGDCLADRRTQSDKMAWQDSLGNARVLDSWRHEIGLEFAQEKAERQLVPVHGRVLRPRPKDMKYGRVDGVEKRISRLVMGCDNQPDIAHASVMFDDFFEAGGNAFDTAFMYGGGAMERLVGHWVHNRRLRDEVVIIGKGAHTPFNVPDRVGPQLIESLERLQAEFVDIYFLHRDNQDVPVGEWIDVLNAERDAGRIGVFGGSNWTLARIQEANRYAASHGRQGFTAVSNNFSLARMIHPVWPGCVAASDPAFAAWLESTQMPLFAWSSQSRGFFTERAEAMLRYQASAPVKCSAMQPLDAHMQRCWFSSDNLERRRHAQDLAEDRKVETINVALAYVLAQPFPCFPLIGPRQLAETRSSLRALTLALSDEERCWLDLELAARPVI